MNQIPKSLEAFRFYFFNFRRFRIIAYRNHGFTYWISIFVSSLLFFVLSNALAFSFSGKNLVDFSGTYEPHITYLNGSLAEPTGSWRPISFDFSRPGATYFMVGWQTRSGTFRPSGLTGVPPQEWPCYGFYQPTTKDDSFESFLEASDRDFARFLSVECQENALGYLFVTHKSNWHYVQSNRSQELPFIRTPWSEHRLGNDGYLLSPYQSCFWNGTYAICFDNLEISNLPEVVVYLVFVVYIVTYSMSFALLQIPKSRRQFLRLMRGNLFLNFVALNMVILFATFAAMITRWIGGNYETVLVSFILALFAYHTYRIAVLDQRVIKRSIPSRILTVVLGFGYTWTFAGIFFVPMMILLIGFGHPISVAIDKLI